MKKISEIDSQNIIEINTNNRHLNFVNPTADFRDC